MNSAQVSPAFTITIVNACEDPISLDSVPISDQTYTITDLSRTFVAPVFTSDSPLCASEMTYTLEVSDNLALQTLSFDSTSLEFTLLNDADLTGASVDQR